MHLKKLTKIGEFLCRHFNIEDRRKYAFLAYYALLFQEGLKHNRNGKKKICAACGEGAVTDRTCQKWFAKFRTGAVSLDGAPWSSRPDEVDNNQIKH